MQSDLRVKRPFLVIWILKNKKQNTDNPKGAAD